MKTKLTAMARKTGMSEPEIKRAASLGLLGLCAAAVCVFFGCAGRPMREPPPPSVSSAPDKKPNAPKKSGLADEVEKQNSGGPWEGYPAGTKYNTISPLDFA